MEFTLQAYRNLLTLLKEKQYTFETYHTYNNSPRCVILRHDIDNSLEQAVRMAEVEAAEGVCSTYFVLLRTEFYNPASLAGQTALRRILELGHEIGLHFDEVAYARQLSKGEIVEKIQKECSLLSAILEIPVSCVSMHRPSKTTLESNIEIPNIVNSYGKTFFHDFKYLSDSRRHWREPVLDIVGSGEFDRLHILTHAFWYHEEDKPLEETVLDFIKGGNLNRYHMMAENIRNIDEIIKEEEI